MPSPESALPSKRIVLVTNVATHPANAGNRARVHRLVADLQGLGHEVHLVYFGPEDADLGAMRVQLDGRLILAPWERTRFSNPLRYRMLRLLTGERVVKADFKYLADVDALLPEPLDRRVAELARELAPDVAIVTYPFYSGLLRHFEGGALKILDNHDRFANRHRVQWRAGGAARFISLAPSQERRAFDRADVVVAIQDEEREAFQRQTRRPVVTLGHRPALRPLPLVDASEPPRILFAGHKNAINAHGLSWFMTHVLPGLRRRFPDLRLEVVGAVCETPGLEPAPGARFVGMVDDFAKQVEDAHVVVNPSLAGTGLHVKNIEAMGYGRPLVMHGNASRGIRDGAGHAYRIAADARGFEHEVTRILEDPAHAARLAAEAFRFAEIYDERVTSQLRALLDPA